MKKLYLRLSHKYMFVLCCAVLVSGCGSDNGGTANDPLPPIISTSPPGSPLVNTAITLANSDWPVIHQNNATTKSSAFPAPTDNHVVTDKWQSSASSVLYLIGENYLYNQAATGGVISAFIPDNLAQGPVHQIDLAAEFRTGGGMIDSNHRLWWTANDRLVRVEQDLSGAVFSQPMLPSIADELGNADFPYLNGTTLLPDSNILVSSVGQFAWIINTTQNTDREFSIVNQLNWQNLTLNGQPILVNETRFSPRPLINEDGDIVIVSYNYMLKLHYNSATQNFDNEVVWAFANPENDAENVSSLAVSHAVQINGLICVASAPQTLANVQQVYCVDEQNGQLVYQFEPFPTAFGAGALHTLGGLNKENWLVSIANTSDNSAGMHTYNLDTGQEVSGIVHLNHISEAFVISEANKHAYISHKIAEDQLAVSAVNLETGLSTEIYTSSFNDPRSIFSGLAPSLSALGKHGLYIPVPDGMVRITNSQGAVWRGNKSLSDANWREQWGLIGWDEKKDTLTNGFWGEDDLEVVADPYNPEHAVLRIHYAEDGVTTESGVGMLFLPELELEDPKQACLAYKQLFDSDFDLGTVGGKLPGLFGFDVNSAIALDATVCAGPYAYDSNTCFSARLGYRNLSSVGYPETTMFYEVIPWMDETECRDTWICDLPYGEGMTMRTAEPESFMAIKGLWSQIEQEIRLNDAGIANGYIRIWYQGELVVDEQNLSITTSDAVPISGIMFHSLFGQGFDLEQGSPIEQFSYIADVEISDSCGK